MKTFSAGFPRRLEPCVYVRVRSQHTRLAQFAVIVKLKLAGWPDFVNRLRFRLPFDFAVNFASLILTLRSGFAFTEFLLGFVRFPHFAF